MTRRVISVSRPEGPLLTRGFAARNKSRAIAMSSLLRRAIPRAKRGRNGAKPHFGHEGGFTQYLLCKSRRKTWPAGHQNEAEGLILKVRSCDQATQKGAPPLFGLDQKMGRGPWTALRERPKSKISGPATQNQVAAT